MSAATDRQTAFPYKLPKSYGTKLQGTTTRLKFRSAATDRQTAFPYKLPKSYGTKLQGTTTRLKFRKKPTKDFQFPSRLGGIKYRLEINPPSCTQSRKDAGHGVADGIGLVRPPTIHVSWLIKAVASVPVYKVRALPSTQSSESGVSKSFRVVLGTPQNIGFTMFMVSRTL